MFKHFAAVLLSGLGLAAWAGPASASAITYQATHTVGTEWRYDYVLNADPAEAAITEFTIYFNVGSFSGANLRGLTSAAGWDGLIGVVDPLLPADGYVDFVATSAAVGLPGSTQGGFSVLFDWFGSTAPGSQPFDILDASTFVVLRSGFTTQAGAPPVPEPATTALLAIGLLLAVSLRRAQPRQPASSC